MKIHYLQHVWFEDLGIIETWARANEFSISKTAFFENPTLPQSHDYDWLVILGGPMNINEEERYPWLREEKKFIKTALKQGKTILGICLGAQLIADCLGAQVDTNKHKEIGWFPVKIFNHKSEVFKFSADKIMAFHWHQDTFEIPSNGHLLACSRACPTQAFTYNKDKVIGLQFHLELTEEGIDRLLTECGDELIRSEFVQTARQIKEKRSLIIQSQQNMYKLLDNLQIQ